MAHLRHLITFLQLLQYSASQNPSYILKCETEPYFIADLEPFKTISTENCKLQSLDLETFGGEHSENLTNLQELNLSNNQLTQIVDHQFFRASNLQKLELSSNKISALSRKSFDGLSKIERISLFNNRLTEVYLDDFVHPTLIFINLGDNKISEIKAINESVKLGVEKLDIYSNRLKDISKLSHFRYLKALNIGRNTQIENITLTIAGFVGLTRLYLTDTNLKETKDFNFLANLCELTYLNLMENSLTTLQVSNFPILPKLKNLNLQKNRLPKICYQCLKEKFPSLSLIQISGNDWDCDFLTAMLQSLKKENIGLSFEFASELKDSTKTTIEKVDCYQKEANIPTKIYFKIGYIVGGLCLLLIFMIMFARILFYRSKVKRAESLELENNFDQYYETVELDQDIAVETPKIKSRVTQTYDVLDL